MALLFCDGFENQGTSSRSKWDTWTYGTNIVATRARTGSKSCTFDVLGKWVPAASGTTVILGGAFYLAAAARLEMGINYQDMSFWGGQVAVFVESNGAIKAMRQWWQGTELGTTAPGVFRTGQWNYLEAKFVLSQTVGTATIKLNGETVLTLTGLDTCYLANTNWDAVRFSVHDGNGFMDDLYACDGSGAQNNDFLGEVRVVSVLPVTDAVAAGSNADFTPSTGTDHGALVDEATPDGDTTYLSSSTVGHYDSWEFGALGYTGTIKGVQLNVVAKKTEASARAIVGMTRPAATNRDHATNRYLGMTDYISYPALWELNPEDSAAWEVADVDGAEFGVKVTV